jgi:hypothetical protein
MPIWPSSDPDVLTKRFGGGCLMLFGLPFLLAGLALIATVFIPGAVRGGDDVPWYVGFPAGGLFALFGGLMVFGRSQTRIDRRQEVVESSFSALATFRRKETPLKRFDRVSITCEVRSNSNSSSTGHKRSYTVYPVRLVGDRDKIDWEAPTSSDRARRSAEELAKFVRLPLHDSSTETEQVREADTLDESLRARASREGLGVVVPDRPARLRSTVTRQGDSVRVTFPLEYRKAVSAAIVCSIILGYPLVSTPDLVTDLGQAIRRLSPRLARPPFGDHPMLLVVIPVVVLALLWIAGSLTRVSAVASADSLRVKVYRLFVGWSRTIPAGELEELFFSGKAIVARSDRKTLSFGGNIDVREAAYVRAILKAALLGQPTGL